LWQKSGRSKRGFSQGYKQQQPKSCRQSFHFNNLKIKLDSHANTKYSISDERRRRKRAMKGTRKITVDLVSSNVQLISYTQETVMRDTSSKKKEGKSNFV
jgi:hypothetical protein